MDLFGPSRTMSLGRNYYGLVIVDHYSIYSWSLFIVTKDDALQPSKDLLEFYKMRKIVIIAIKIDHGVGF